MFPLRLFLSYISEDLKIVQPLYKRLIKDGYDVWFDKVSILPGQDWQEEIRRAVKSADVVIVCLSNKTITKEGFIQKELRMALDVANEKPEDTIYLVPIKIEECPIPEPLTKWQWVNMFDKNGYEKLLRALQFSAKRKEDHEAIAKVEDINKSPYATTNNNSYQLSSLKPIRSKKDVQNVELKKSSNRETKEYFVGHALNPENIHDLREAIRNGLSPFGYSPYYADKNIEVQQILFTICKKIYSTDFGIFDISTPNPNVFMEIGITISLNKNFILIARENSWIPKVFEGLDIIFYENYSLLEKKLNQLFKSGVFKQTPNLTRNFCVLCRKACDGLEPTFTNSHQSYVLLDKVSLLWQDISKKLNPIFSKYEFESFSLTKNNSGLTTFCDIRKKIESAKFSIIHFGKTYSDEISYLALGLTIGSRKPWLILRKNNDNTPVPSNLEGFARIEYEVQTQLESLEISLKEFIEEVSPSGITKDKKTKSISSSFGVLLQDWIEDFESQFYETREIDGAVLLIKLTENNESVQKIPLSKNKIIIGRDINTADIVINDDPYISSNHASITRTKSSKWSIQDLGSQNGTKINNEQIDHGRSKRLYLGDTIKLSPLTKFIVWDKSPLPFNKSEVKVTARLDLIPLNLRDVIPPENNRIFKELVLVVKVQSTERSKTYEIQNYYTFGRILRGVSEHLNASERLNIHQTNCFFSRNEKIISNDDTPESIKLQSGETLVLHVYKDFIEKAILRAGLNFESKPKKPFDFEVILRETRQDFLLLKKNLGFFLMKKWSEDEWEFFLKVSKDQSAYNYKTIIITTNDSIKHKIETQNVESSVTVTSLDDLTTILRNEKSKWEYLIKSKK